MPGPLSDPTFASVRGDSSSIPTPTNPALASPASPFLSEEAHVLSLQHPDSESPEVFLNDSKVNLLASSDTYEREREVEDAEIIDRVRQKRINSDSGPARKLYLKTMKSIEARLKGKTIKDVRDPSGSG